MTFLFKILGYLSKFKKHSRITCVAVFCTLLHGLSCYEILDFDNEYIGKYKKAPISVRFSYIRS